MSMQLPGRRDAEFVVVLDCLDPELVGAFWAAALGYRRTEIDEPYCSVLPPEDAPGIELLLQRVPEQKAGKNRLHFDIRVQDIDAEVARLHGLGATVMSAAPVREHGWTWYLLADPEGNEFCVLRPAPQ